MISPNDYYPESFATIQPGRPWMFPLRMRMDNDWNTELISFVFARPDYDTLPNQTASTKGQKLNGGTRRPQEPAVVNGGSRRPSGNPGDNLNPGGTPNRQPTTVAENSGANRGINSDVQDDGRFAGNLKNALSMLHGEATRNGRVGGFSTKIEIDIPSGPSVSRSAEEVCCYLLGPGLVAKSQFTLKKGN